MKPLKIILFVYAILIRFLTAAYKWDLYHSFSLQKPTFMNGTELWETEVHFSYSLAK